ncbi:hypothetical protein GCM10009854_02580 [Saccharopolyspora halophila]|uniref:Uncharacterized protein n=1 Tax=Saccharopolyspora halophila TaxID=405551 RepID=A0ABN3FIW3_9PSEU
MTDEINHRTAGPDPILLAAGAIAIVIGGVLLLGLATSLHWILAATAVAAGVGMLIAAAVKKASK